MSASSAKLVLRVLPVAALLVAALVAAVVLGPDTFRYRGWPKPVPAAPLQALVGVSPQLGHRDPMGLSRTATSPAGPGTTAIAAAARSGRSRAPGSAAGQPGGRPASQSLGPGSTGRPRPRSGPAPAPRGGGTARPHYSDQSASRRPVVTVAASFAGEPSARRIRRSGGDFRAPRPGYSRLPRRVSHWESEKKG